MAILQDQNAAILAELAKLRAENEKLKASRHRALSWKVSEKGAISIYGMGRFPVTLYWSQFQKLAAVWDDLKVFAQAAYDNGELSVKD
jgi:hypothetical protein